MASLCFLGFLHLFVIFTFCLFSCYLIGGQQLEDSETSHLKHLRLTDVNELFQVRIGKHNKDNNLEIFCFSGEDKQLLNILKTVSLRISAPSNNYEVFLGENATRVIQLYEESRNLFYYAMPTWSKMLQNNRVEFSLYNASCIGVNSDVSFTAVLDVKYVDFWKVFRLTLGIVLFFAAPFLSCNKLFYYSSGILFGIVSSLLIVVYVFSRFIPRRVGALSVLVGGWAIVIYFLQLLFFNLKEILLRYQNAVIAYLLVMGFISFGICYKYGHIADPRTRNLIRWTLQAVGLLLIFYSAEWKEAAMCIVLMVLATYNFPAKWMAKFRTFWRRKFPPKIRLLSEDEYHAQVASYTKKALEDLRQHCNSPECEPWKYVKKLRTPLRFADFVEGKSHLTDDEVLDYEMDLGGRETDDESFSENSDMEYNNGNAVTLF